MLLLLRLFVKEGVLGAARVVDDKSGCECVGEMALRDNNAPILVDVVGPALSPGTRYQPLYACVCVCMQTCYLFTCDKTSRKLRDPPRYIT